MYAYVWVYMCVRLGRRQYLTEMDKIRKDGGFQGKSGDGGCKITS